MFASGNHCPTSVQLVKATARLYSGSQEMSRRTQLGVFVAVMFSLVVSLHLSLAVAQEVQTEIRARARVLNDIGPGLIAVKRDSSGRYFVAASSANSIAIFSADSKRLGQIPPANLQDVSKDANNTPKISFIADFDLDATGHLVVADRGANTVKVFDADGSLLSTTPIPAPSSVAALPGEEFAVTSLRYHWLMGIYAYADRLIRAVGEPADFAKGLDPARTPDLGRVSSDPAGNLYFAFSFLPVPTVRRFDRFGYAGNEIALDEFSPEQHRRELFPVDAGDHPRPVRQQINALGVDPVTQEIWIAVGDELLRFDKDGARTGLYRTLSPAGAPLSTKLILVEPDRLLLGTEAWGIFDFARPAKASAASPSP